MRTSLLVLDTGREPDPTFAKQERGLVERRSSIRTHEEIRTMKLQTLASLNEEGVLVLRDLVLAADFEDEDEEWDEEEVDEDDWEEDGDDWDDDDDEDDDDWDDDDDDEEDDWGDDDEEDEFEVRGGYRLDWN
jgi:hypothetical protein